MEKNLLLLFNRPCEPLFVPKGDEEIAFEIPANYLADEYQEMAQDILPRFGSKSKTSIVLKNIAIPNLTIPLSVGRYENFSVLYPKHIRAAGHLINLFLGMRTTEDLLSLCAYCRDRMNAQMFIYALSVALLHRPDTKNLPIPSLSEMFPDQFFDSSIFRKANLQANIVSAGQRAPINVDTHYTSSNADPEQRIAYFREDVGVNSHHWHWHLVYPNSMVPRSIIDKDRRGELFYHHHHQLMARYNVERLCNGLPRVKPLNNLREPIPEGYFPKLDHRAAGKAWASRPRNMILTDVNLPHLELVFSIAKMEQCRDRIIEAIRTKKIVLPNNKFADLDIDKLGNILEASDLSLNKSWYGDLHNWGHISLGYIHDPDARFLEEPGTMGSVSTSMRDPVFYRWHQFVDDFFTMYKDTLQPYGHQELDFPGVSISDVSISAPGANTNTLNTHWTKSDVELSRGLDFAPQGSIGARVRHLNYSHFTYNIVINNAYDSDVSGTVRIFIAPRFDLHRRPLLANEQRLLMIEMDKFTVRLNRGENVIERSSTESALTIPFEATYRKLNNKLNDESLQKSATINSYCGCGWPQYMLVPRGTVQGYEMDLFVMISDYEQDRVDQAEPEGCQTGVVFCGLKDRKYPDARDMGYPFDRSISTNTIREFMTPNMKLQQVTVRFSDVEKPHEF